MARQKSILPENVELLLPENVAPVQKQDHSKQKRHGPLPRSGRLPEEVDAKAPAALELLEEQEASKLPIEVNSNGDVTEKKIGRPLGAKNKMYAQLRGDLKRVYELTGGMKGLLEWVRHSPENKAKFYDWLVRMLPREVEANVDVNTPARIVVVSNIPRPELPALGVDGELLVEGRKRVEGIVVEGLPIEEVCDAGEMSAASAGIASAVTDAVLSDEDDDDDV